MFSDAGYRRSVVKRPLSSNPTICTPSVQLRRRVGVQLYIHVQILVYANLCHSQTSVYSICVIIKQAFTQSVSFSNKSLLHLCHFQTSVYSICVIIKQVFTPSVSFSNKSLVHLCHFQTCIYSICVISKQIYTPSVSCSNMYTLHRYSFTAPNHKKDITSRQLCKLT